MHAKKNPIKKNTMLIDLLWKDSSQHCFSTATVLELYFQNIKNTGAVARLVIFVKHINEKNMPTVEFIDGESNRFRVYIKPALGGRFCTCPESSKTVIDKDGIENTKYLKCVHLKAFSKITSIMDI